MKTRELLTIRKGLSYLIVKPADISYIYTDNDITYIVQRDGSKVFCSESLNKLEKDLGDHFFRASRQCIINLDYIVSFRSYERVKIIVEMDVKDTVNPVCISQVTAPKFKNWIAGF